MLRAQLLSTLFLYKLLNVTLACPEEMTATPCQCVDYDWRGFQDAWNKASMTNYGEPVTVFCANGANADEVKEALQPFARTSREILALQIRHTHVGRMRKELLDGLRVTRLSMSHDRITSIEEEAFAGGIGDSLEALDLSNNNLKTVPTAALLGLKQLRHLSLANNAILTIQPNAFASMASRDRLQSLDLSGNFIDQLYPTATASLHALRDLKLQRNNLTAIPMESIMKHSTTLRNLDLALNYIEVLPSQGMQMVQLVSLSLEYNKIETLSRQNFLGMANLIYLYLGGNEISSIHPDAFCDVNTLRYLSIGGTKTVNIENATFKCLRELTHLDMNDGTLETIGTGAMQMLPNLRVINLRNNKISSIDQSTFAGMLNLVSADLSRNNLQTVSNFAFSSLPSLRHLDLSGNQLEMLQPNTFDHTFAQSSDASTLYLCGNRWKCDTRLSWFRRWLRDNMEMVIDRPDCPAVCLEPPQLQHWPIRFPNPPPPQHLGDLFGSFLPPDQQSRSALEESLNSAQTGQLKPYTPALLQVITGNVPEPFWKLFKSNANSTTPDGAD